ncbi:hypothetical protein JTB14_022348 [Gonioctena quinquepunctata]|nr:hypothetical protein JTB14_022348 [Gonioctena quinquepunctata]
MGYLPMDMDTKNIYTYCTVAEIVTIRSMKTGDYIDGAGNGFYIFENVNTSAIMDIRGGCYEGMNDVNVITYRPEKVAPNNRFYISALDNTIGVQCAGGGKLRLKNSHTWLVVENIDNPRTSDDDIHFLIEPVS